jgi:hypothetical protein
LPRILGKPTFCNKKEIAKHSEGPGASCGMTVSDDYVENWADRVFN